MSRYKHAARKALLHPGRGPSGSRLRPPPAQAAPSKTSNPVPLTDSDGKIYFVFQLGNSLQVCNKREKLVYCRIFSVHLVLRILIPPKKDGRQLGGPLILGPWEADAWKALETLVIMPIWGQRGWCVLRGLRLLWRGLVAGKGANEPRIAPQISCHRSGSLRPGGSLSRQRCLGKRRACGRGHREHPLMICLPCYFSTA